jgi:ABC-type transport system involved in multi-copper enzyme maturation permease subunit
MVLAIPLMAVLLFWMPNYASYYVGYVLVFNILTAPVFTAGSVTGERERQTLDLLLTTTISSWQIMWGKLFAGFRVSFVLTAFLMFPMVLACISPELSKNWRAMLAFFGICIFASVFNTVLSLFVSTLVRKTSTSLMTCYVTLLTLYCLPIAIYFLFWSFAPPDTSVEGLRFLGISSPLMAADSVPMTDVLAGATSAKAKPGSWPLVGLYFAVTAVFTIVLATATSWLFQSRWRLTGRG